MKVNQIDSWFLCLLLFLSGVNIAGVSSASAETASLDLGCTCKKNELQVFFASTRLNEGSSRFPLYGKVRHLDQGGGSVDYGASCIEQPNIVGNLSQASNGLIYKQSLKAIRQAWDTTKTTKVQNVPEQEFFNLVQNWPGKICLYTHGYDISFEDALKDAGILCAEYNRLAGSNTEKILPIVFTWPSIDSKADYSADESNVEWSQELFRQFVNKILSLKQEKAVLDIVAHSMGNQLLLWYCVAEAKNNHPGIRNIFLSSADIDFHTAEQQKDALQNAASNMVYIFVSDKDGPLILSEYIHKQPRLGRPIDPPYAPKGTQGKFTSDSFVQLGIDAASVWLKNALNNPPDVMNWLSTNQSLEQDFGPRAQFVDVTDIVNDDMGHGLPWSIIAGLMQDTPNLGPFSYFVAHKRPDKAVLLQNGGKPAILYKFNKIDIDNFHRPP